MKEVYYAFTETNCLKSYAKTQKKLLPSLENINILNKDEYNNIIMYFFEYLFAGNVPIRITGACYLKLIYENDTQRFKENIFDILEQSSFSSDDIDDYEDIEYIFIICDDIDLYKKFLEIIIDTSHNLEVKNEAKEHLIETKKYLNMDEIFGNSPWYQTYKKEYSNLKEQLKFQT